MWLGLGGESLLIFCLLFPQHRNLINAMEKTTWNESTEEEVRKVMTLKYLSTDESNYETESDNEECQQS